jgi:hypothetical protein
MASIEKTLWVVQHESKPIQVEHPGQGSPYILAPGDTVQFNGLSLYHTCLLPPELPSNTSYVLLLERGTKWSNLLMQELFEKTLRLAHHEIYQEEVRRIEEIELDKERIRKAHEVLAEELTQIGMHCTRLLEDYFLHGMNAEVLVQEIKNLRSKLYVQAATERLKKCEP